MNNAQQDQEDLLQKQIVFGFMWTLTGSVKVTVLILNCTIKHGIVHFCRPSSSAMFSVMHMIGEEEVHYLKPEDE